MFRLFQFFQNNIGIQTLIRLYLKTGNKNENIYNDIQCKWIEYMACNNIEKCCSSLLSLDDENDITTSHFIFQVRKISTTPKDPSYTVAIHTDLSYVLFEIIKIKKTYRAFIVKAITRDLQDYQDIYQNILPSLFMEFILTPVIVSKAFDCELSYINQHKMTLLMKGEKQNVSIYSNSLYIGDCSLITIHDELN
jgi:hypothetical protein